MHQDSNKDNPESSKDDTNLSEKEAAKIFYRHVFYMVLSMFAIITIMMLTLIPLDGFKGRMLDTSCKRVGKIETKLSYHLASEDKQEEKISSLTKKLNDSMANYEETMRLNNVYDTNGNLRSDISDRVKSHMIDHSCRAYWDRIDNS